MGDKKMLIAGAGGYLGTRLVDKALQMDKQVIALDTFFFGRDKLRRHCDSPNLTIVEGDIRDIGIEIFEAVGEIVNVAGISNDPACDLSPDITLSINRDGCIRFAKLAKEAGVERYVDMSSCAVYGRAEHGICDENTPPRPVSLYAQCKVLVEDAVLPLGSNDFCILSLRNSTVFGVSDRMRFDLVVNIMTFNALTRGVIKISGDGEQSRPLIHIDDVAESCMKLLGVEPTQINGRVFNLVGINARIIEIAERIKRMISDDVRIEFFSQDFDIRNYTVDGNRLKQVGGIDPRKTIEEGVRTIVENLKTGRLKDSLDCYTVQHYKHLFNSRGIQ